jgi:hypothetical protein
LTNSKNLLVLLVALSSVGGIAGCSGSDDGGQTPPPTETKPLFNYENVEVRLDADLVVPAGHRGRIGPGAVLIADADIQIRVEGVLDVEGSAESPSRFTGSGTASSWYGILVAAGGRLTLKHAELKEARYGVHALAGSSYEMDYADISGGFKAAVLESDGTIDHSHFAGAPPTSIAVTLEVSIDDPNGTMTIMNASPTVKNSSFDGASAYTDMVRIGGQASPTFDHVQMQNAHCGFHTFGGVNTSPRITNSVFQNLSYGIMAFQTKPSFESCVFQNNTNDVGLCLGAAADNAPVLSGNYYASGSPAIDAGCFAIGTNDPNPAASPIEGAGPVGL